MRELLLAEMEKARFELEEWQKRAKQALENIKVVEGYALGIQKALEILESTSPESQNHLPDTSPDMMSEE